MLKPATPLAVVLFIAFALLLLATISTPIIKGVPLASFHGVNYGVFGYCSGNTCSSIGLGYGNSKEQNFDGPDFSLPANTRLQLSNILIVHPVACLFTLICFILTVLAHLRGPGHSSRYLLGLIIFLLPTLLLSLLAFLIDILLFAPHQSWGAYLVLVATILIAISDGLTCCMRRTLVSRKDQRRRIEENAEMNGENYYNREAAAVAPPPTAAAKPFESGASGANSLPSFATFEKSTPTTEEDRIPLHDRTATGYSGSTSMRPSMDESGSERYGMGPGRGGPHMRGRGGRPFNQPRDEFGNPLPPSPALGGRRSSQDGYPRNMPPNEYMRGRGRGGYPPRGMPRGGPYNGRGGGPPGRGGMGPGGAMLAGAGAGMVAGDMSGRNRGPPGYSPYGGRGGGYGPPGALQRGQSQGSSYSGRQPSPGPPSNPYGHPDEGLARAESPPPLPGQHDPSTIGQAIEMDERTGSPGHTPTFPPANQPLRDSDSDLQGMVGLQRGQMPAINPSSNYSQEYVPARTEWSQNNPAQQTRSPHNSPPPQELPTVISPSRARRKSEPYYEDTEPRFSPDPSKNMPNVLLPRGQQSQNGEHTHLQPHHPGIQPSASYDSIQDGPLSESSNFTSISERGVNPQWQSEQQRHQYGMGGVPNRQAHASPVSQQRDFLLTSNPDFGLGNRASLTARGSRGGPVASGAMI